MGRTGKLLAVLAPICAVPLNVAAVHASTDNEAAQLPPAPLDPSHCSDGTYVEEPISYAGLVVDCILLVTIRNHFISDPANSEVDWIDPWKGTSINNGRVSSLNLGYNQLYGPIPAELGNLTGLEWLGLSRNQLSGPIPPELGDLTKLKVLGLEGNRLTGNMPSQLGNLVNLEWLALNENRLSGPIPAELASLVSLKNLYLNSNKLSGNISPTIGHLINLLDLRLSDNQLSGPIPAELSNLTNLKVLGLEGNQLSGSIPSQLSALANLLELRLDDNQLSGPIPLDLSNLANLEWLGLPRNQLSGPILHELGDLTNLKVLGLDDNQLTGPIPPQLSDLENLQWLALDNNQLSGPIPTELSNLMNLGHLSLSGNQLSGSIPSQLGNLSLNELWIQRNQLSGEIPAKLRIARSFRFCNNQLTGTLPVHLRTVAENFSGDVDDIASCYEGAFRDDDGSVHEINIEQVAEWGITLGCGDNQFCPSRIVTRAQMAAFLYRASTHLYDTPDPADEVQFSDVADDAWYLTYAQWASTNGVIRATDGNFNPQASVTRADMAEMLVAAFDHLSASTEFQGIFSDVVGIPYATIRAMEGIYDAVVATGCSTEPRQYCPTKEVTRAQMASFLTRAIQLSPS